jgi:hypothetical protein
MSLFSAIKSLIEISSTQRGLPHPPQNQQRFSSPAWALGLPLGLLPPIPRGAQCDDTGNPGVTVVTVAGSKTQMP